MTTPRAIVIGAMKAGTTWLHSYLEERRDVCLPDGVKETFFFDRHYDLGIAWYRRHFAHFDGNLQRAAVEVAPSYFHCSEAPARIRQQLGEVRLVAILRDPVKRAWSHYCHLLRYGYTRQPLRAAVAEFPAILDASRYGTRLQEWSEVFPRNPVVTCSFELLADAEHQFCQEVCDALDLPYVAPMEGATREVYAGGKSPSMMLARASRTLAHGLRRRRLHFLVNGARQLGLKTLVYGGFAGSRPPQLSEADSVWLTEALHADIRKFGSLISGRAPPWLQSYT